MQTSIEIKGREELVNSCFSGISVGYFVMDVNLPPALVFIRKFLKNFSVNGFNIVVHNDECLEKAVEIRSDFPRSRHSMHLRFMPVTEKLFSLPPLAHLIIMDCSSEVPFATAIKLLETHRNLYLTTQPMQISLDEWQQALQLLSADTRQRKLEWGMESGVIAELLSQLGITSNSQDGYTQGEFEVVENNYNAESHDVTESSLRLRYKNCWIKILDDVWTNPSRPLMVTMETSNRPGKFMSRTGK